jgi:nucleoside-diphosphate-sugar epimerase
MKLLIIGGAGYVGKILRPTLEERHDCSYLDLNPIPGAEDRCLVGDLNDPALLEQALRGRESVVWLAAGVNPDAKPREMYTDTDLAFDVNVKGFYRVLRGAELAGIKRFVYASSLSVHGVCHDREHYPVDEAEPPTAWDAYGMSKRLGEYMGEAWVQRRPEATFVGLRLLRPRNEEDWPYFHYRPGRFWYPIGPNDLRRLFLAAIALERPGVYIMQASGDLGGEAFPNSRVAAVLGWRPESC